MAAQFEIALNEKWCKSCGICVAFCPKKVLALNEMKILTVVDKKSCIGCHMCEYRCPDMAISVEKKEGVQNE